MNITVQERERGFLFHNGRFVRMLAPGKHRTLPFSGYHVRFEEVGDDALADEALLSAYKNDEAFASSIQTADIPDGHIALHYVDGRYRDILEPGKYAFWNVYASHTFRMIDIGDEHSADDIPASILDTVPEHLCKRVSVEESMAVLLYVDGKFSRRLPAGKHFFWRNGRDIAWTAYDMRAMQIEVPGQEILTVDKVALRVNFVCTFRIVDPVRVHSEIRDYWTQVYVALQLALRELMGNMRFDEILEVKNGIADKVLELVKKREAEFHMEFLSAGLKDIILPGEVREIMNTVLIAEKRAQANVITRREEVASTRSLLNTARLMDENKTLYKLKELEYLEKICDKVGSISVGNATGLLEQLGAIMNV